MDELDRGDRNAGAGQHKSLKCQVFNVVIFHSGAALDLAQSPAVATALDHVHADADTGMFEGRLEHGRHARVRHQSGGAQNRFGMLPGLFCDQDATWKQQMCLAANLVSNVDRRSSATW